MDSLTLSVSSTEILGVCTWVLGCAWFASAQVSAVRGLTARMIEVRDEMIQMRADGAERSREIATIKARLEDIDLATRVYRRRFSDDDAASTPSSRFRDTLRRTPRDEPGGPGT